MKQNKDKQNKKQPLEEKKEKPLEESLKDPVYVNYNILLKLEEIKKINYAILEIFNALYQRILEETSEAPKKTTKKKEEREGTLSKTR